MARTREQMAARAAREIRDPQTVLTVMESDDGARLRA